MFAMVHNTIIDIMCDFDIYGYQSDVIELDTPIPLNQLMSDLRHELNDNVIIVKRNDRSFDICNGLTMYSVTYNEVIFANAIYNRYILDITMVSF